jgi:putative transposase
LYRAFGDGNGRPMFKFLRFHVIDNTVCAELAGDTVPLREILRARNRRRRELRGVLRDRQAAVNTLLDLKRGEITEKEDESSTPAERPATTPPTSGLKRYRNE